MSSVPNNNNKMAKKNKEMKAMMKMNAADQALSAEAGAVASTSIM
jgi:hypothetical protein